VHSTFPTLHVLPTGVLNHHRQISDIMLVTKAFLADDDKFVSAAIADLEKIIL
jgi:hypothetical protein